MGRLMGWNNPAISWKELERRLSGLPGADDAPVSRRKRRRPEPREAAPDPEAGHTPYAELHCHSHYSFLDGASSPAELVDEAVRLGLHGAGPHRPRRLLRRADAGRGGRGPPRRASCAPSTAPSSPWG